MKQYWEKEGLAQVREDEKYDSPIWHKISIPVEWPESPNDYREEILWVQVKGIENMCGPKENLLQFDYTGFYARDCQGNEITLTKYQLGWVAESRTLMMEVLRRWADILEAQVSSPLHSIPDGGYCGISTQE